MTVDERLSSDIRQEEEEPSEEQQEQPEEDVIPLQRCPHLYIKYTPEKGRGVFSSLPLPASTILDTSPVLPLSPAENEAHISKTELYHYTYNWPATAAAAAESTSNPPSEPSEPLRAKPQAIILGLGSMFNHSTLAQNVGWTRDVKRQIIVYRTLRDVEAGEELCISYGAPGQLTFVDAEAERVRAEEEEEARREGEGGFLGGIEL
ncbi:hypothetical protein Q7P36_010616 [Cladosporium allicinum]